MFRNQSSFVESVCFSMNTALVSVQSKLIFSFEYKYTFSTNLHNTYIHLLIQLEPLTNIFI